MHRRRRLARGRQQAEQVWIALSGAKRCNTCKTHQVSGRLVLGTLFCDNCDAQLHFIWPRDAVVWHA